MENKFGSVKRMLIATSLLEGVTGLLLTIIPSLVSTFLFGMPLNDSHSIIITRVGGVAVVSIALVCWFLQKSESQNGLVIALLFYNLAVSGLFGYAGLSENLIGIALWPAVATHIALASWCFKCLFFGGNKNA